MNDREYHRRKRRIEWMLTGHSKLRDRYGRRATGLTLAVMTFSMVGLLLALANGDQHVSILGVNGKLQVFLACLAAVTFFVALLDLVVDWRRRGWAHSSSAKRLGELSVLYGRAIQDEHGEWAVEGVDLAIDYERVMGSLEPIPDKKAASMKATANRKRAVFTLLDAQPGIPLWWAKVVVTVRGLQQKREEPASARTLPSDETREEGT